jgi:CheY-like chemotaxis protein
MSLYKNILLVEDDKDDQMLFVDILREVAPDTECTLADNGQYALELIRASKPLLPDLIVLDLNMPVMDGFEFIPLLKSTAGYQDIPLVVLTTSPHYIERCYELGADLYIRKPDTFLRYADKIRYMLTTDVKKSAEALGKKLERAAV